MKRNVLLNPGPVTTKASVKKALLVPDVCHRVQEFYSVVDEVRELLLKVAQADASFTPVLLSTSGTGAVEACISSVVPKDKKIAIIVNGTFSARMLEMAKPYNIDVVKVLCSDEVPFSAQKIDEILERDPDIACVAAVYHETSTGILNPIEELAQIVKKRDRMLIVDAVSCFGGIQIDLKKCPIDFLVATPNKCIEGFPGIAFVISKKSSLEKIKDNPRTYYLNIYAEALAYEQTGAMRFTPPVQIIYSLRQALKELIAEGLENRCSRYKRNSTMLSKGLKEIGFKFFSDSLNRSTIVTSVLYPENGNFNFGELYQRLYEKGFTIYPGKKLSKNVFQVANIGSITKKDISSFLNELKTALAEMNCELKTPS